MDQGAVEIAAQEIQWESQQPPLLVDHHAVGLLETSGTDQFVVPTNGLLDDLIVGCIVGNFAYLILCGNDQCGH